MTVPAPAAHTAWMDRNAEANPGAVAALTRICTEIGRSSRDEPADKDYRSGLRVAAYALMGSFGTTEEADRRDVVSHEITAAFVRYRDSLVESLVTATHEVATA